MDSRLRRILAGLLATGALLSSVSSGQVAGRASSHPAAVAPTGTPIIFETGGTTPAAGPASATPAPATATSLSAPLATSTGAPASSATVAPLPTATAAASSPTVPPSPSPMPISTPDLVVPQLAVTPAQPPSFGALDHSILLDNGYQVALVDRDGGGRAGLSFLSADSGKRPRFSGGWQYIYYNNGFWLGDIFGHQRAVAPPAAPGEQVYDAIPSPDGQYIAWQMVTPADIGGNMVNMGASRIVITDATGGNARTLLQQSAGSTYGDIPLLYGWQPGNPPLVLVQTNYAIPSMFGLHKGLEAFDPTIDDMVNDYLPPLDQDTLPQGEVLGVSASGVTIVFATQDRLLPSGEGPFPVDLKVMTTGTRHITSIDAATAYQDGPTGRLPAPTAYIFYRQAFVSPDNSRLAYTRLDILYPKGATRPYVRPIACLANLDGSGKVSFGPDEYAVGWIDGHTVVVQRVHTHTDGLYAVDLNSGASTRILLGNGLRVDGIIP